MELNHDCVRDILLTIEDMDYTLIGESKETFENEDRMKKYESKQILYTLKKLHDAEYIHVIFSDGKAFFAFYNVHSMNYKGHELLDTIRDDKVWQETKSKAAKVTSASLPVIQQIAVSVSKKIIGLE